MTRFCFKSEKEALSLKGLGKAFLGCSPFDATKSVMISAHVSQTEAERIYIWGFEEKTQGEFLIRRTTVTIVYPP